jgi:hypothetical protein
MRCDAEDSFSAAHPDADIAMSEPGPLYYGTARPRRREVLGQLHGSGRVWDCARRASPELCARSALGGRSCSGGCVACRAAHPFLAGRRRSGGRRSPCERLRCIRKGWARDSVETVGGLGGVPADERARSAAGARLAPRAP